MSRCCLFFFFSSRRRHTRFDCDWSSDVCSSDLSLLEKREKLWIELRFFQEVLEQITSGNRMKLNFAGAIQNREAIPGRESGINQGLKLRHQQFFLQWRVVIQFRRA